MKKIVVLCIIIIITFIIPIPSYVELNNLAIIEGIAVSYNNRQYTIWLKETIPTKGEQGINYEYKYYKGSSSSIDKAFKKAEDKTKKKLYLKRTKFLVTNLKNSDPILKKLQIKPKSIYHSTEDIEEKLKEI